MSANEMELEFFVSPTHDGRWRWYAEIDGKTVREGRFLYPEQAAITAAGRAGATEVQRFRYAHEHRGCLEKTHPHLCGSDVTGETTGRRTGRQTRRDMERLLMLSGCTFVSLAMGPSVR